MQSGFGPMAIAAPNAQSDNFFSSLARKVGLGGSDSAPTAATKPAPVAAKPNVVTATKKHEPHHARTAAAKPKATDHKTADHKVAGQKPPEPKVATAAPAKPAVVRPPAPVRDAMKKVYDDAAKQITGEQEVHARHILVPTEEEAKAIKAELDKGADFAKLAKEKSKDPGAADGGDLGFFTKEQMVPEFSAVAFTLEPGKISDPVKSQFGWHIIKVEEKRNRKAPDFAQVKPQIEQYVTRKAQSEYVAKLRETAKVERMNC